jgi:3-oxoacyl-[acyl-carrier-protein] synthase III
MLDEVTVFETSGATPAPRRTATVLSVATELPEGRLTTADLAERLGVTEDWIYSRTGIRERPQAADGERLSDCAARAGAKALAAAGVDASQLDLVIVATITADELTPNTAPLVAHELGAVNAGAFDVGAACTGFLTGMSLAAAQIETGRASHVLLVGADFVTRITDYSDRKTAPLFADGAGAVVIAAARDQADGAIGPIVLGADGAQGETIVAQHTDRLLSMDGPEVFRHAVARMAEATLAALQQADVVLEEIDLFVFHQANARITKALGERIGADPARVVDCIEYLGNSSAATLPLAFAHAQADGRLKPGARVLVGAFGAGFTYGAGVLTWGAQ